MKTEEDRGRYVAIATKIEDNTTNGINWRKRLMSSIFFYLLLFSSISFSPLIAQDVPDIDEWQVMKVAAARDPFAHGNQFTINFANYTEEEWCYPLPGAKFLSPFGGERHHGGTDIKTFAGDTTRAAFPGEVILSESRFGYGYCVVLRHANGLETLYSHHSRNLVKVGQWLHAGDPIGIEGRTGRATTDHLHFETRVKGTAFDSERIFDHANQTLRRQIFVVTKQKDGTLKFTSEKVQ